MKLKNSWLLFMIAILALQQSVFLFASDDKANEIIKEVKKEYDDIKTFHAEFTQTFHWILADNINEQHGTIWLKGKEKFKIVTEDQTIVSNGKTIWTYSQFNNQVIIDDLEKSGEDIRLPKDLFFKYSEQYKPSYVDRETVFNQECDVLELTAKTEDIFIKYMKMWINKKTLIPIKILQIDLNKNENTYFLKNIELNKPLEDNFFDYKIPDSVEVIDMR